MNWLVQWHQKFPVHGFHLKNHASVFVGSLVALCSSLNVHLHILLCALLRILLFYLTVLILSFSCKFLLRLFGKFFHSRLLHRISRRIFFKLLVWSSGKLFWRIYLDCQHFVWDFKGISKKFTFKGYFLLNDPSLFLIQFLVLILLSSFKNSFKLLKLRCNCFVGPL